MLCRKLYRQDEMRLISPLLKHVIYPGFSKSGYLRKLASEGPATLTYHGVFPEDYAIIDERLDGNLVSAQQLRSQLQFLKEHYELISPEDFRNWCRGKMSLPPRALLLTCDDGLRNNLTVMLPVLREFDVECLFFVTNACTEPEGAILWHERLGLQLHYAAGSFTLHLSELGIHADVRDEGAKHHLGRQLIEALSSQAAEVRNSVLEEIQSQLDLSEPWLAAEQRGGPFADRFQTMGAQQLRQLADAGMCVGAHSISHPNLARMSDQLATTEIMSSRETLSKTLGEEIWAFAYPFGNHSAVSAREIALAEQCGFTCAFLNVEHPNENDASLFALPRTHVTRRMTLAEIDARISGLHASLKHWLA
jgi:peptidoglycan/xylan/chitin deacetylase (PgdA/CDA1 family)